MFTLPPDESYDAAQLEGSSDENPIVLFGESADDFAILLDALYALPPQLAAFHSNTAPLDVLLTLTSLLNKYQFSTTCEWALVALYRVVSGHYGTPPAIEDISLLERIVEVACVCNYAELREWVEEKWISRILQSPGGWAEREARFAINAADTWGLKKLGAMAYYSLLLESNDKISPTYSPPQGVSAEDEAPQPPPLSSSQIFRALSGHMSLVNLWETIRISPPTFARPEGCVFHSQGCVSAWSSAWAEAVRSELTLGRHKSCHVLGRLKVIEDQLTANTDLQCALTPACRKRAIAAVRELHAKVVNELPQHFQNDMAVA
ncbi:hypothetical protein K474DRAFT_110096 [Panus rudis PR-1116 ss-1]|nr:hypothetical protein K474DRAFT_110096 [Panus rudis PR-1116 ss-1]